MCREGGCGACLVQAEVTDYLSEENKNITINSVMIF